MSIEYEDVAWWDVFDDNSLATPPGFEENFDPPIEIQVNQDHLEAWFSGTDVARLSTFSVADYSLQDGTLWNAQRKLYRDLARARKLCWSQATWSRWRRRRLLSEHPPIADITILPAFGPALSIGLHKYRIIIDSGAAILEGYSDPVPWQEYAEELDKWYEMDGVRLRRPRQ